MCFDRGLDDAYTWYREADRDNKTQLLARARYVQMRARALQIAIGQLLLLCAVLIAGIQYV